MTHDAQHSWGLLRKSDQVVAETSTWQHTQHSHPTKLHATGGIRTRNLSIRAAADPRFSPRGQWDQILSKYFSPYLCRSLSPALQAPGRQDNLLNVTTCASILFCQTLQHTISKNKSCVAQIEELPDTAVRGQQQESSGTAVPTHCCRQIEDGFRYRGL